MLPIDPWLIAVIILIAFLSGIGITSIGPGGIFVTIALYSFTVLPASSVAGTAHATFIAAGIVGSLMYIKSGELLDRSMWKIVIILSLSSGFGAIFGVFINTNIDRHAFGILLGISTMCIGAIVLYRSIRRIPDRYRIDMESGMGIFLITIIGLMLGTISGLLGIGGPVLAVPLLVLLGMPMVFAVAVAQVQSIWIATIATVGYLAHGGVSIPLAILIGVPLLMGVAIGWKLAHAIEPVRLRIALGTVLIGVGPFIML